ncbi:hypothetical protein BDP27DRAFT_1378375 [Rhodocollybia butyracea]|uniref:Uncharacterized protein n=1 Tax=Rhodocollybia butyracea TaxID=206335 RepID=A0A9P5NZX4_9AGAR|nr:hypothetical protein BDP27DRAFT_1378375 [Rhodocollybia butyracea]
MAVKRQAMEEGRGWVSTGDIMVAFFVEGIISICEFRIYKMAGQHWWTGRPPKASGDVWSFSSLMVAGVNKLDLGSETLAFWHWSVPLMLAPSHMFILNKFKGGYIFDPMVGIHSSRWKSIQKVLQSVQDGKGIEAV